MPEKLSHIADLLEHVEVRGEQNLTLLLACIHSLRQIVAEQGGLDIEQHDEDNA